MNQACLPTPTGLTQKIDLLGQLASSLQQAQAAVARSDMPEVQRQTAHQERLCEQLRQLGQRAQPAPLSTETPPCIDRMANQLARVELEVAQLNRAYGALLRRASRTVNIFCRLLAASELTYAVRQATTSGGLSGNKDV